MRDRVQVIYDEAFVLIRRKLQEPHHTFGDRDHDCCAADNRSIADENILRWIRAIDGQ